MRLLDRYILREWLVVFLLALACLVGLQLLALVQNQLDDLRGYGATWAEIIRYFLTVLPSTLPLVLPIALAVAILYSLGDLHRRQETTAMRAAGQGVWEISRGLWLVGLIGTGVLFLLNAEVVPRSIEQSRTQLTNLRYQSARAQQVPVEDVGLIYNLTFFHEQEGRLWFINRFNDFDYRAHGLTISQFDARQREMRRIAANEGFFDDTRGHWSLRQGRITDFSPETGEAIRSQAFAEMDFVELTEEPDLMKFLEKKPNDLSFFQLQRLIGILGAGQDTRIVPYQVQYWSILFTPLRCLIVVGLTVPFALGGVRTNPFIAISKSAGLLLLYVIASVTGRLLAGGGLSPLWAAALPNALMVVVALGLTWRASRPA